MAIIVTGRAITGTASGDFLAPRETDNVYLAYAGSDTIEGGGGADYIDGGEGFDFAVYSASSAAVTIDLRTELQFGGQAEGDRLFSIEGVIGSDFDDRLTGNDSRNHLWGGKGLDVLDGRGDDDLLGGGIDGKNDLLIGGDGVDMASYFDATENMTITLDGVNGTFGSGVIDAKRLPITLNGHQASIFVPAIQEDTLLSIEDVLAGTGNDTIFGNAKSNRLQGNSGNDVIHGGVGTDTLIGGSGNDRLSGGLGGDVLTGGPGSDVFVFTQGDLAFHSIDRITDFKRGEDKIDLSAIDAASNLLGNQGFRIVSGGLTGGVGELSVVLTVVSPNVGESFFTVKGDTNGDRQADFTILVETNGQDALNGSDFIL
jgi:Ca2+-binding RTX toxin-like protein